ncbi:RGS domain-containing protein [Naegleria gruberi]|uniref:RGS domain-containing protein n=1 Tax=Naegleria gruberi TaxID=5762 RepID=D2VCB9_NAEGR|nr:RGS domain-containing protein [Naegleria gruberi]EFC45724.1 RGS domain-containing protein [Naegleria gruberi]|eukprot:XP_002678468.1 RGS domain-containing protein [Naegleria gruberi strain NEG-M]
MFDFEVTNCDNRPDISDAQFFRRMTGYANFSQLDIDIISNITGKTQINGNWTLVNDKINLNMSGDLSLNETWQNLLPSTCYMCQTDGCYGEDFVPILDYFIIPQFLIIVIYFLLLFGLKVYKKPSIKRRIGIPYTSLLILGIMLTFTGLSRTCVGFWYSVSLFCFFWWVTIYGTTIVRFYYLRNLYSLIVMFPKREKLLKMLASQKAGLLVTVVLTFPISHLLNLTSVYYFVNESKIAADVYRPIILLAAILILWIFCGLCLLLDLFLQRKNMLKGGGIRKFFFFDDPFYFRVDLISTFIPLFIGILTGIENSVVSSSNVETIQNLSIFTGIFNTLLCLSFVQISGGNVLLIEIYKMITKRKEMSKLDWDQELKNADLLVLLKEYCEKEFSSENYEFYIKLKSLQGRKFVKFKELQEIEAEFIRNYSKYEVNLPFTCRRKFYSLLEKCEAESQIEFDLVWRCVETDLLLNLQDTFNRLQQTSTYSKWLSVQNLKKTNNI